MERPGYIKAGYKYELSESSSMFGHTYSKPVCFYCTSWSLKQLVFARLLGLDFLTLLPFSLGQFHGKYNLVIGFTTINFLNLSSNQLQTSTTLLSIYSTMIQ